MSTLSVEARYLKKSNVAVRLRWIIQSHLGGTYTAVHSKGLGFASKSQLVRLDLDPASAELSPSGHQRPWDAMTAAEVLRIELRAETTGTARRPLEIELSNFTLDTSEPNPTEPNPCLLDLALSVPPADIKAKAALTFQLDPLPLDPFASSGDGNVLIQYPNGDQEPAFLIQAQVVTREGSAQQTLPSGAPRYKVYLPRWPTDQGLTIVNGRQSWLIPPGFFQDYRNVRGTTKRSSKASSTEGMASTSNLSRWQLKLEGPLIPRIDKGSDPWVGAPQAWRLTPLSPKVPIANAWHISILPDENQAWFPLLFWNARWGRFGGIRRPSFSAAKSMDLLLARAHRNALTRPLCLLSNEWFSRLNTFNWISHPAYAGQGGSHTGPGEFLRSKAGITYAQRMIRYAVARWGRSKAVSSFFINLKLNTTGMPDLHARIAEVARRWPVIATGEKALLSLHPLALEPRTVTELTSISSAPSSSGAWFAGEPQPSRIRPVPHTPGKWEAGAKVDLEALALSPLRSVCAIKTFRGSITPFQNIPLDDFHQAQALLFDVWVPANAPSDLRAGVHLRGPDGLWFQTLLPGLLNAGDWTTCMLDLTYKNTQNLTAVHHKKDWSDYTRRRLKEIGLHVFTTHPERKLSVRFSNVRAVRFAQIKLPDPRTIKVLDGPEKSPRLIPKGGLWECHLSINHTYANPFDLRQVDLVAEVHTPSGKRITVPAFFDQPCVRREAGRKGAEIVEPKGRERWTVRFRVQEEGPHRVTFMLRENGRYKIVQSKWRGDYRFDQKGNPFQPLIKGEDEWLFRYRQMDWNGRRIVESLQFEPGDEAARLVLDPPLFTGTKADQAWRGFLRVDPGHRYFRYDDRSFYYALGPCLRSPSDNRIPYFDAHRKWVPSFFEKISKRGTYQFDEYLAAFQKAGINWTRIWACSWWCGLQWRRDWPGYQGLGRYNLLNAWRLDHILDEAERRGVRVSLCLTNHGQFSRVIDSEWNNNPYNQRWGGPLESASEFFTRAEAKIPHLNYLRYVAARWGHSPAIMTWELFSELEFTEDYLISLPHKMGRADTPALNIMDWHREMAVWLKAQDPNRHLISTHFSHPVRGESVFKMPEMELAMSNAYSAFDELAGGRKNAAAALSEFWKGSSWNKGVFKGMQIYRKPVLVEEQGRHWMGGNRAKKGNNTRNNLDADLHAGLWGSLVQPLAGATGYWWWLHVHFDDRYEEYRALANFVKGEDFRADQTTNELDLNPFEVPVAGTRSFYTARALGSNRRAYVWVYDKKSPYRSTGFKPEGGVRCTLRNLDVGYYSVEFWDTTRGRIIRSIELMVPPSGPKKGVMNIALPTFTRDMAIKIKWNRARR